MLTDFGKSQIMITFASQSTINIHETDITDLTADDVQHLGLFAGEKGPELRGD